MFSEIVSNIQEVKYLHLLEFTLSEDGRQGNISMKRCISWCLLIYLLECMCCSWETCLQLTVYCIRSSVLLYMICTLSILSSYSGKSVHVANCHSRHSSSLSAHGVNSKTLSSMINLSSKLSPLYVLQVGHKMCCSKMIVFVNCMYQM